MCINVFVFFFGFILYQLYYSNFAGFQVILKQTTVVCLFVRISVIIWQDWLPPHKNQISVPESGADPCLRCMMIWEKEKTLLKICSHKLWLGLWAHCVPGAFQASGAQTAHKQREYIKFRTHTKHICLLKNTWSNEDLKEKMNVFYKWTSETIVCFCIWFFLKATTSTVTFFVKQNWLLLE